MERKTILHTTHTHTYPHRDTQRKYTNIDQEQVKLLHSNYQFILYTIAIRKIATSEFTALAVFQELIKFYSDEWNWWIVSTSKVVSEKQATHELQSFAHMNIRYVRHHIIIAFTEHIFLALLVLSSSLSPRQERFEVLTSSLWMQMSNHSLWCPQRMHSPVFQFCCRRRSAYWQWRTINFNIWETAHIKNAKLVYEASDSAEVC